MKKLILILILVVAAFSFGFYARPTESETHKIKIVPIKLGTFSVSLNVKDINASKEFYESLGFAVLGGDLKMNYLIMKNENALIGLFQGMFQGNILTFNPGWNENGKDVDHFDDVRRIQQHLQQIGIKLTSQADANSSGPASITLTDPDGNVILIDQHR